MKTKNKYKLKIFFLLPDIRGGHRGVDLGGRSVLILISIIFIHEDQKKKVIKKYHIRIVIQLLFQLNTYPP